MKINQKYINIFNEYKLEAQSGKGNILIIEGENGVGKTYLIKQFIKECNSQENSILNVYVQNEAPIGVINVRNLQPLKPFAKALEVIIESKNITAKKQLAVNMSLTALTALPFIGDVFYAAKELSRDWKQYKKEKTKEEFEVEENRVDELINAFAFKAEKEPLVIFIDNAQYIDSSSVELLNKLKFKIRNLNILLILSFNGSEVIDPQIPFYHFNSSAKDLERIILKNYDLDITKELSKLYIKNYQENDEFDQWIFSKTIGNASELFEFYDYFKGLELFDKNGELLINLDSDLIPTSSKAALAVSLSKLTSQEKDILAIAAREGYEFSTILLSDVYNIDILQLIRKLKTIQEESKIIRSIGSFKRYGTKTTVYQFNQVFYYNYFNEYLEEEEKENIHSRISNFLRKQIVNIDNPEEKKEIMANIISHSHLSGDTEQIEKTYQELTDIAKSTGDIELLESLGQANSGSKINIEQVDNNFIGNGLSGSGGSLSFSDVRRLMIRDFHKGEFQKSIQLGNEYFKTEFEYLTSSEKVLLLCMTAKVEINSGDIINAKSHLSEAEKLLEKEENKSLNCLFLNINAALHNKQGHYARARKFLKRAADLAIELPAELRLLTLSNISVLLDKENNSEAKIYKEAAKKLQEELEFNNWWN